MMLMELVRRTLVVLDRASDDEIAGYMLDAHLIRVHPRLVSAVRKSMKHREHALSLKKRRVRCRAAGTLAADAAPGEGAPLALPAEIE
jgi:hypothetical protein